MDEEQVGQQPADPMVHGGEDHLFEEDDEIDLAESSGETAEGLIGADGWPNTRVMMLCTFPVVQTRSLKK